MYVQRGVDTKGKSVRNRHKIRQVSCIPGRCVAVILKKKRQSSLAFQAR